MSDGQNSIETQQCDICGRKVVKERLTLKLLFTQFLDTTFSLDKGFIYTFWHMLIKPKKPIISYLEGFRKPYSAPAKYLVVTITVYVLATFLYDFESLSFIKFSDDDEQIVKDFYQLFQRYINVVLFFAIPIISFFLGCFSDLKNITMLKI